MAKIEDENSERSRLKAILEQIAKMKTEDLARKELTSELSFESGVPYFSRMLRIFQSLNDADLEDVPLPQLQQLRNVAEGALNLLLQVQNFTLAKYANNPIETRNQFINQIRDYYDQVFSNVAPTLAFTIRKGTDFKRLEEQAKSIVQEIETVSHNYQTELNASLKNAQETVEAVRRIAQEAGVSQHFVHFKNEADQNAESAKPWLSATILIAAATVIGGGLVLWRYLHGIPDLSPSQSVQVAIPKIFVFSILLSAMVWAGKTYRAYRHNVVVNRHRQNALATFEAFAKAASDNETKNAVLLQATQCIFSPQQTGYVPGEPETAMPPVLEIVRNLGGKAG
jgi:hypothetical protein